MTDSPDQPPATVGDAVPRRRPGRPKTQREDQDNLRPVPIYMTGTAHEALKWQAFMEGKSMSKWVLERIMPDLEDAMEDLGRQKGNRR